MNYIEISEIVIKTYEKELFDFVKKNWSDEDVNRLKEAIMRIKQ